MRKFRILTLLNAIDYTQEIPKYLFYDLYFADPSVDVFHGKIYIYSSHDIQTDVKDAANGVHFNMKDYHVLTLDNVNQKDENALLPKVALLKSNMKELAEEPKNVLIIDENGNQLKSGDQHRRFF